MPMAAGVSKLDYHKGAWTEKQLRHLLRRTLFGVSQEDYLFFKGKSMEQCIEILIRPLPLPPPHIYRNDLDTVLPDGTSFVFADENKERDDDWAAMLQAWWVGLMINPQRSVREKMVLFWHNHSPIEFTKVKDSRYAYHYLNILRQNSTGNFKQLLKQVTVSPGMLVYLGGNLNSKNSSNENYGRELQELFTVGKGPDSHYTEADVKAAAKVLTGWKDDKKKISSYFDSAAHNADHKIFSAFYGNHTIKGRAGVEGALETDDLIAMICAQKEVSKFLCRKLYRWFVHSHIDSKVEENVIAPLAEIMVQSNYEIKPVLKAMFTSAFFYNPEFIGAIFKSPVDYFVGVSRELNLVIRKKNTKGQLQDLEGLFLLMVAMGFSGQYIGNPPSVAGWPASYGFPYFDKNWVNSEYLTTRSKWIRDFTLFQGLNKLPDTYVDFDYLKLLKSVSNPANTQVLVRESLHLLCSIQPDEGQLFNLQKLLEPDKGNGQKWPALWSAFQLNSHDDKLKNEVLERLRKTFTAIILLPEYQIM